MPLSPHFALREFLRSSYAARRGIDMTPPDLVVKNLKRLCVDVLEPLREAFGAPMYITSGYRPPGLNLAVGGSVNSDHLRGLAADFVVPSMPLADAAEILRRVGPTLPIGQAIQEFGEWLHVSIPEIGEARRAFYVAVREDSRTVYKEWNA